MDLIGLLLLLAATIEHIVQRLKKQLDFLAGWKVEVAAYGLGVLAAYGLNLHAVATLGAEYGVTPPAWADGLFTGLVIGAGSAAVNRLFGRRESAWDSDVDTP